MQTVASRLPHDDLVAELKALNARFIHNYVTNDVDSHDAMMHPDFICIGSKGTRQNRADYLKQWATQFDPEVVVYWDVRDEVITIIDNVALVRSTNKRTIRRDGGDTTSMSTYTDTYLFQNSEWKCIQAQIQTLPPESYPGDDTIVSVYIKGKRQ
jgi:ketosteroid isomerase-like protein